MPRTKLDSPITIKGTGRSASPARRPTERPLTVRQERFCERIAAGDVPADAWIKAGHNVSRNVAKSAANRALTNVALKARIAVLRAPDKAFTLRRKDENLRYLCEVMLTPISEIGPSSPLCIEYTEDVIAGGSRGKLKRGNAASGNETVGETILRRKVKKPDPLRAMEIYNRMRGHNEPDRTEIEVGPKTLLSIRDRAAQVTSALAGKYGRNSAVEHRRTPTRGRAPGVIEDLQPDDDGTLDLSRNGIPQ